MSTLLTIGQVARDLSMPRWRLQYLIERGELPEPSQRVPGRRLFTAEDVEQLRIALAGFPRQPQGPKA